MDIMWLVVAAAAALALGGGYVLGRGLLRRRAHWIVQQAEERAREVLDRATRQAEDVRKRAQREADDLLRKAQREAENLKREKLIEAKDEWLRKKQEFDQEVERRRTKLQEFEQQLKNREFNLDRRADQLNLREQQLREEEQRYRRLQAEYSQKLEELEALRREQNQRLERIAGLTAEEARQMLIENMLEEARNEAAQLIKEIREQARLQANREAKKIIIQAIQRTAAEHTIENTVSVVNIQSDDMKGRIIGREGRNIRAFEAATGVEVIVDDTPEAVILSCFDPVRREIARIALERLIQDGRIHPARIEEVVARVRQEIEEEIFQTGERAVIELGIANMHPELVRLVGRMRFRSSYGQNLLAHSMEVARLAAIMAAELGLDAKLAKRAGLLHDIGKVIEGEPEGPHALVGMEYCRRYGEHPIVCNAVGAHHDEIEMDNPISPLVQAADAISGARPGARRETIEQYIKRLQKLEEIASQFEGVQKVYALQAGREVRVTVEADRVDDARAELLAIDIAKKIEQEMQYPGQIKVTVIREVRAVSYAK